MRFDSIKAVEQKVKDTGNNGEYTFSKVSLPVPGETLKLTTYLCVPKGRAGYFYNVEHPKKRVVLHFTAGNLRSDLSALTRDNYHVSVAFVIGRDGTIYQLFSSKYWSGHIGKGVGNDGTGNAEDKCSIGIELSNYGYLTPVDGNLETYYSRQKDANGKVGPADVYCANTDKASYKKLDTPFRSQSYYATHTEEQYNSLIILLRYLTAQFKIPRNFMPEPLRYTTTEEVRTFNGIVSHINYRINGKWDIGQAFDWNKVINGVKAQQYTSIFEGFESAEDEEEGVPSEEALDPLLPKAQDKASEDEEYEDLTRTYDDIHPK